MVVCGEEQYKKKILAGTSEVQTQCESENQEKRLASPWSLGLLLILQLPITAQQSLCQWCFLLGVLKSKAPRIASL